MHIIRYFDTYIHGIKEERLDFASSFVIGWLLYWILIASKGRHRQEAYICKRYVYFPSFGGV